MLRFHIKKKCINFGSYLDKQRMHFNLISMQCGKSTVEHDKVI